MMYDVEEVSFSNKSFGGVSIGNAPSDPPYSNISPRNCLLTPKYQLNLRRNYLKRSPTSVVLCIIYRLFKIACNPFTIVGHVVTSSSKPYMCGRCLCWPSCSSTGPTSATSRFRLFPASGLHLLLRTLPSRP